MKVYPFSAIPYAGDPTGYPTTLEVGQDVATLVGIAQPPNIAGNIDPLYQRLLLAINRAGDQLAGEEAWEQLSGAQTVTVDDTISGAKVAKLLLPEAFDDMINDTMWNLSTGEPAVGPLSNQEWSALFARTGTGGTVTYWRIRNNRLEVMYPPPTPGYQLRYEYVSEIWVIDNSGSSPVGKTETDNDADYLLFDKGLIVELSRAKWLEIAGLDSSAAMRDYMNKLEAATLNQGNRTVNLNSALGFRLIDWKNAPDTGYGLS